jgi:hypothetical protein
MQKIILGGKNHITVISGILIAAAFISKLVFENTEIFCGYWFLRLF